ncbi:MAG: FMN-binding protein [Desulfobacteraceae bacterium]|nr:FMN-binding protein [Desulfobacteraceae bacterium]MDH3574082.1 FMN-binding protein [Desulfobacteraceae bacterium]MDH3721485.1 FMN-binding protein [Desulfobacteraceae bacterium]MDH3836912.1 FMN-binding protein [Desulfobacteraceae bacterium]MDH3874147.1 FMN-binding protein [Desulfobacteraceae bacterium]
MSKYIKSILFTLVLSLVCGGLLTLASTGLREYQLKNIELDKSKNILKSVGLLEDPKSYSTAAVAQLYEAHIRQVWVDVEGKVVQEKKGENDLLFYLFIQQGKVQAYIIPVHSRGLWGKIAGYLSIRNDGATISGFTVYSHQETPGLGGEIEKKWFQKNFKGKTFLDDQGNFVSVTIAKGTVKGQIPKSRQKNFVDGISGASMTGKFLSAGLKETLNKYEPLSKKIRTNGDTFVFLK